MTLEYEVCDDRDLVHIGENNQEGLFLPITTLAGKDADAFRAWLKVKTFEIDKRTGFDWVEGLVTPFHMFSLLSPETLSHMLLDLVQMGGSVSMTMRAYIYAAVTEMNHDELSRFLGFVLEEDDGQE